MANAENTIDISMVKFDEKGLVPAVVQEENGQVLMLAYMNEESLKKTLETGYTWFFSRSRQKLWQKGETSGNVQKVKEISYDCDGDTLLVRVHQTGVACHTGTYTCFSGRKLMGGEEKGIAVVPVMLHVGLGTFRPVKESKVGDHVMHSEYFSVSPESADEINRRRAAGGRVIAVGRIDFPPEPAVE